MRALQVLEKVSAECRHLQKKKKMAENINITSPHASGCRHEVRIKVERLTSTHQYSLGLTLVFVLDDVLYTDGFSHASLYNM